MPNGSIRVEVAKYHMANGDMTFYGIGVGRLMALIIEDSHDGRGPVWPWLVGSKTCFLSKSSYTPFGLLRLYREYIDPGVTPRDYTLPNCKMLRKTQGVSIFWLVNGSAFFGS